MTVLDAAPLEQFVAALWEPDDLVEIRPLPTTAGRRRWLPAREVPALSAALRRENDGGADLYAGVLPRTVQGGGSAEHTDGGRVVWIDCDHIDADAALARVRAAEVPAPVLVADSGHGAHVYWRLAEKLPREAHTRLLKAVHAWLARDPELAAHLDAKTQEPARIMRLPGFLNHKPPPAPCRVVHYAPEAVCEARDWTPALLAYTPDPERPRAPYQPPATDGGGNRQRGYALAALSGECREVAAQGEGNRNNRLNIAATKLGGFVASGALSEEEVRTNLRDAALAVGLPAGEIDRTLASGLRYGAAEPRHAPERPPPDPDVDLAGIVGRTPALPAVAVEVVDAEVEDGGKADIPVDPGPFPSHLLEPPGFISEVAEFCLDVAFSPQPVLALGGAVALQAVLAARKIADATDNRTNLYIIGIAPGSAGKDRPLKVNREILFRANASELEGACDFASDAGLIAGIAKQPAILFQIDEVGRMLRSCGDARSAHLWNIASQLVRLFSLSESVYKGKAYADTQRNVEIVQPCASLFGVTVGHHYYESLTRENLIDGLVARLLVLEGDEKPMPRKGAAIRPPERLLEPVRWWKSFNPSGNLASNYPVPFVVPEEPEAAERFAALAAIPPSLPASDDIGRTLWGRAKEKACRLALAYAASRDRHDMRVDDAAAEWACELASYTTRRMLHAAWHHVADNHVQKNKQRLLRMLMESPGGKMPKNLLTRRTQDLKGKERDELLADLVEANLVRVERTVSTGGRCSDIVRLV